MTPEPFARRLSARTRSASDAAPELRTFAVTDRSQGNPTTLVTVLASPSRLVLGQGANVDAPEALRLLGLVDFEKVINAK